MAAVTIEVFPSNPEKKRHCLVWTRPKDGQRIVFSCGSEADCKASLAHYDNRAAIAEQRGWDNM